MEKTTQAWNDQQADKFVTMADVVIPERMTQLAIVVDLLPFSPADTFRFIDIGCGQGLLSQAILTQFPRAICYATDGSASMISRTQTLLEAFGHRVRLSQHNLHQADYLAHIVAEPVEVITSSLTIHHCHDSEKQLLYKAAHHKLTSPGAFIVIDVVKPAGFHGVKLNKKYWQAAIRRQSRRLTGNDELFEAYKQLPIMFYDQPAAEDKPTTIMENLHMLQSAGFQEVDCFWMQHGFAIFGGYK